MKLLTLLRHAKSSWNDEDLSDHDRPLNKRGRQDAPMMARRLMEQSVDPDLVLCSTALRARETLSLFTDICAMAEHQIHYVDGLYLASVGKLASLIAGSSRQASHLLLVGHNPGLEDLLMQVTSRNDLTMPTCAMAQLRLASDGFNLAASPELLWFDYPKRAESALS